jgi:LmbE family N-acetylglucosaminyl deacetylase
MTMTFNNKSRVLVVAAHPDDEVLGCGGTLAKAIAHKAEVYVLFLGEGISARFPIGEYNDPDFQTQTSRRIESAEKALACLGITQVSFGSRFCCQFDSQPILSIVKEIELAINDFNPDILLTHNPIEVNIDHRITYEAVEIACRPTTPNCPREIYAFEVVCSSSWTFNSSFKPNVFVDVSRYWEQKMKAWAFYADGEARIFPFPRSIEGLTTLSQFRGMSAGQSKTEAFRLLRAIIND